MRVSDTRILTTHTGSLPRPPALVELYVRKAAGEAVDAELAEAGHAAMEEVVRKQRDAGIDIGNNGEQQREAFFLYVRGRMSGFGGSWDRPPRGDVDRYPLFKAAMARDIERQVWVSAREGLPTAIGDIQYLDRAAVEQECADFRGTLDRMGQPFAEPFMTAPSPGIVAAAMRNDYYPNQDGLSRGAGQRVTGGIRNHRAERVLAATGLSGSGDGAALHLAREAAGRIPRRSSTAWCARSTARWSTFRVKKSACMCAGAITRGRTIATWN